MDCEIGDYGNITGVINYRQEWKRAVISGNARVQWVELEGEVKLI